MTDQINQRYLDLVDEVEARFDVANWRSGDVDLWPAARMDLFLDMFRAAGRECALGSLDEVGAERTQFDWRRGYRHQEIPGRAASTAFASGRLRFTSSLNRRAALSPKMLRLACSERNGSVVIALGGSKSQCGQSEA